MINRMKKLVDWLAGPDLVFFTLPWLMVLLTAGTLAQPSMGLLDAQQKYFSSFILWIGPVPLPGGYSTSGLILLGLVCKFLFKSQWTRARTGINVAHLGVLVLLLGGLVTAVKAKEGYLFLFEGETANVVKDYDTDEQRPLPFSVTLIDVEKENYPGTDMAKAYVSQLEINDNQSTFQINVSMNAPLRYRGYTFYQSSYVAEKGYEASVLAVVDNRGWLFPYLASFLISLGLAAHLAVLIYARHLRKQSQASQKSSLPNFEARA